MNDNRRNQALSDKSDAAAWFVDLQRHPHDPDLRRRFDLWLGADPLNAIEWERVSTAWSRLGATKNDPQVVAARAALAQTLTAQRRRTAYARMAAGLAAVGVLAAGATGYTLWRTERSSAQIAVAAAAPVLARYTTPVGGARQVTLEDGSRITLNTDTEVRLTAWGAQRALTVAHGEAYFEVAKNPRRPFVVTAAGRTVTALGTAFDVRVEPARWAVTLVEGKVRVQAGDESADLTPGQRLSQQGATDWTIDSADIRSATSWRDGRLVFENQPLGAIAEEMNRYSVRKIRIDDARLAATPLSGQFKAGDVQGFVDTLQAYGLAHVSDETGSMVRLAPTAE